MVDLRSVLKKQLIECDESCKRIVIKGTGISPYVAKGPARIIRDEKSLEYIKEGEVAVLINSTPLMVPYLMKAVGLVGESKGYLNHLAIVSREFEKACVNGIPEVTKILNDGDLIEVDGIEGIVRVEKK